MTNNTLVYLCDLRYNYSGVLANDCMPLGVAYMKAVIDQTIAGGPLAPLCLSRPSG